MRFLSLDSTHCAFHTKDCFYPRAKAVAKIDHYYLFTNEHGGYIKVI